MTSATKEAAHAGPSFAGWSVRRIRYRREEDGFYESLFALTNGFLGLRATVDFDGGGGVPGCFLAPLYGPAEVVPTELVNAVNPALCVIRHDGVRAGHADLQSFEQSLNLRHAWVTTRRRFELADGSVLDHQSRAMLPAPHRDLIVTIDRLRFLSGRAEVTFAHGLDWGEGNGRMGGTEPAVRIHHLRLLQLEVDAEGALLCFENRGTCQFAAYATASLAPELERRREIDNHRLLECYRVPGDEMVRIVRIIATAVASDPSEACRRVFERRRAVVEFGLARLVSDHRQEWRARWRRAEVRLEGPDGDRDREGFRFGVFQLLQAPDRAAIATNVAARGLTSEYHSGHVFFNTELFLVPYYSLTEPAIAKAMLRSRLRGLDEARRLARDTGYAGARFPEEADLDGRPAASHRQVDVFTGRESIEWSGVEVMHLTSCVLYALHRYLQATGDTDFLLREALPLLVDGARYCADLMRFDERVGGRGARNVMCFDEFHYHVDHHWGTNELARWALVWGADIVEWARANGPAPSVQVLRERSLSAEETSEWRRIAGEIFLPATNAAGVIEQYLGYFALPDQRPLVDGSRVLPTLDSDGRLRAERLDCFQTRLIKQADIVLVLSMFPGRVEQAVESASLAYYRERTLHGSSLSLSPHALLAGRLGWSKVAAAEMRGALRYNLDFVPRNDYRNGVHVASYAGGWLALVEGLMGMHESEGVLRFAPRLPPELGRVELQVAWRGRTLALSAAGASLTVESLGADPVPLAICVHGTSGVLDGRERRLSGQGPRVDRTPPTTRSRSGEVRRTPIKQCENDPTSPLESPHEHT